MADDTENLLRQIDARTRLLLDSFEQHAADMAFLHEVRGMAEQGKFFEPLRAAAEWRDTQQTVKSAGIKAATGAFVTAMAGLLWLGFADKIKGIFH